MIPGRGSPPLSRCDYPRPSGWNAAVEYVRLGNIDDYPSGEW